MCQNVLRWGLLLGMLLLGVLKAEHTQNLRTLSPLQNKITNVLPSCPV